MEEEEEEEEAYIPPPLDKYQQMKLTLAPFLDGLQTQHTNPTQKSYGSRDLKHPSTTYEVLVVSGAGPFLDELTEYHALSNTTDTMQIQNLVRARGLDDPAKLHWQSIPNENPDLAAIFDMGKQLPTPDATSTQIYLLRGLMAQLWRTPHTLEHVERNLAKHKLTPPDKRGLLAFHLHVSK
jgi:hypothetical protein